MTMQLTQRQQLEQLAEVLTALERREQEKKDFDQMVGRLGQGRSHDTP